MANSDYQFGAFTKSKMETTDARRVTKKAAKEAALLAAYAVVDIRDGSVCWVTGVKCDPNDASAKKRREHHHLRGRNVMPEWVNEPDRIITVSRLAHRLITKGQIVVEGDDARLPLFFHWSEDAPTVRPLVIRRRNKAKKEDAA